MAGIGIAVLLSACGLDLRSPDLFVMSRSAQGRTLTLLVNDGGTIRCDRAAPRPLPNRLLLEARDLATSLAADAKSKLHLPPAAGTVYSYTVKLQDGPISFPDTAAASHPELARAELFALQAAQGPCRAEA